MACPLGVCINQVPLYIQNILLRFGKTLQKEFQVLNSITDALFFCRLCLCLNYLLHQSVEVSSFIACCCTFPPEMFFTQLKLPKSLQGSELVGSFRTVSSPIRKEYWTSSKAIWLLILVTGRLKLVIKLWNSYFCDSVSGWSCTEKDNFQLIRNLIFLMVCFLSYPRFQRDMFGC